MPGVEVAKVFGMSPSTIEFLKDVLHHPCFFIIICVFFISCHPTFVMLVNLENYVPKVPNNVFAIHGFIYPMNRRIFQWDGIQINPIFHHSCVPLFSRCIGMSEAN